MQKLLPVGIGRQTQSRIFRNGAQGHVPAVPASSAKLESAAIGSMSQFASAYVCGSSGMESTAEANRAAFERWRIVPRMLRDVSRRETTIELFGHQYPSPVIAGPVGVLELVHPEADIAVAEACAELGVPYVFSNQASHSIEKTAAAMGESPFWFQLYWSSSDELVASFLRRAEASGAQAIVITLDTHSLGWRPRDLDLAYLPFIHGMGIAQYTSDPVFRQLVRERTTAPSATKDSKVTLSAIRTLIDMTRHYPGNFLKNLRSGEPRIAVETFLDVFSRSSLTWDNLAFAREHTDLPIVLKGIQHPEDALLALKAGVDAIVVSNHGGRQVDGAIGALDALPAIVQALSGRMPVLFDSGIRGGSDILKALALGAKATLIGRPYVYGLAIDGRNGVRAVLGNLIAEFDLALGLSGHSRIADLGPESLVATS